MAKTLNFVGWIKKITSMLQIFVIALARIDDFQ